ncbi:hypothetical protein LIPSTDRAFT_132265 [Lipomyces starkeyi NRRL Y-11557]|uniref:Uncharacterized protein n=1 Tax=Lipomyces starkeyi NRRL Y-11557 TaxID=675824 RepID=A0A1E3QFP2_LIPST|nr:hypothetical protein LIPSTDRAFT_132265 [Lipomyces starkeyi NRRL Y-11557]
MFTIKNWDVFGFATTPVAAVSSCFPLQLLSSNDIRALRFNSTIFIALWTKLK